MLLTHWLKPEIFMIQKNKVIIYTDGACKGNPGIGGWGASLSFNGKIKEIYGAENDTTNNRMELTAAIEALNTLTRSCDVALYTDSQYVKNGITQWIANWKKNNWKTAAKKAVKNKELWQKLDAALATHQVEWRWVKGHSGDEGNERADELANIAIEEFRQ